MFTDPDSVEGMAPGDPAIWLLKRIGDYWAAQGYNPSVRDLEGGPGLLGRSQVAYHRDRLAERGLVIFMRGVARSLRLSPKGERIWTELRDKSL